MYNTYRDPTGCYGDHNIATYPQNVEDSSKMGSTASWQVHPSGPSHNMAIAAPTAGPATTATPAPAHFHSTFHHHPEAYGYAMSQVHKETDPAPSKDHVRATPPPNPTTSNHIWQNNRSRYAGSVTTGGAFLPYPQLGHFEGTSLETSGHIHAHSHGRKPTWSGENPYPSIPRQQYPREPSMVYADNLRSSGTSSIIRHTTNVSSQQLPPVQQHIPQQQPPQQSLLHHQQQHMAPHHELFSQLVQKEREARRLPGHQESVRRSVVRGGPPGYHDPVYSQHQHPQFYNSPEVLRKPSLLGAGDMDRCSAFTSRQAPSFNHMWNKSNMPYLPYHPQMPPSHRTSGSAFQPCGKVTDTDMFTNETLMWTKSGQADHSNHSQISNVTNGHPLRPVHPGQTAWISEAQSQMFPGRSLHKQGLSTTSASSMLNLDSGQLDSLANRQGVPSTNLMSYSVSHQHLHQHAVHMNQQVVQHAPPLPPLPPPLPPPQPPPLPPSARHQVSPHSNPQHSPMVPSPHTNVQSPCPQPQGPSRHEDDSKDGNSSSRSLRSCLDVRQFLATWDEDTDIATPRPCVDDNDVSENLDQPTNNNEENGPLVVLESRSLQREEAANLLNIYPSVDINTVPGANSLLNCSGDNMFSGTSEAVVMDSQAVAPGVFQNLLESACGTSSGSNSTTIATPMTSPSARTLDILLCGALPTPPASQEHNVIQTSLPLNTPVAMPILSTPHSPPNNLAKLDGSGFGLLSPSSPPLSLKFDNPTKYPTLDDHASVIQSGQNQLEFIPSPHIEASEMREVSVISVPMSDGLPPPSEPQNLCVGAVNQAAVDAPEGVLSPLNASAAQRPDHCNASNSKRSTLSKDFRKRKLDSPDVRGEIHDSFDSHNSIDISGSPPKTSKICPLSDPDETPLDRSKWAFAQIHTNAKPCLTHKVPDFENSLQSSESWDFSDKLSRAVSCSTSDILMVEKGVAANFSTDSSKSDKSTSLNVVLSNKDTQTDRSCQKVQPIHKNDACSSGFSDGFAQTSVEIVPENTVQQSNDTDVGSLLNPLFHSKSIDTSESVCSQPVMRDVGTVISDSKPDKENMDKMERAVQNITEDPPQMEVCDVLSASSISKLTESKKVNPAVEDLKHHPRNELSPKYHSRIVSSSPGNIPKILLSRLRGSSSEKNGVIKKLPSIRLTRVNSPMSNSNSEPEYVCSVSDIDVGTQTREDIADTGSGTIRYSRREKDVASQTCTSKQESKRHERRSVKIYADENSNSLCDLSQQSSEDGKNHQHEENSCHLHSPLLHRTEEKLVGTEKESSDVPLLVSSIAYSEPTSSAYSIISTTPIESKQYPFSKEQVCQTTGPLQPLTENNLKNKVDAASTTSIDAICETRADNLIVTSSPEYSRVPPAIEETTRSIGILALGSSDIGSQTDKMKDATSYVAQMTSTSSWSAHVNSDILGCHFSDTHNDSVNINSPVDPMSLHTKEEASQKYNDKDELSIFLNECRKVQSITATDISSESHPDLQHPFEDLVDQLEKFSSEHEDSENTVESSMGQTNEMQTASQTHIFEEGKSELNRIEDQLTYSVGKESVDIQTDTNITLRTEESGNTVNEQLDKSIETQCESPSVKDQSSGILAHPPVLSEDKQTQSVETQSDCTTSVETKNGSSDSSDDCDCMLPICPHHIHSTSANEFPCEQDYTKIMEREKSSFVETNLVLDKCKESTSFTDNKDISSSPCVLEKSDLETFIGSTSNTKANEDTSPVKISGVSKDVELHFNKCPCPPESEETKSSSVQTSNIKCFEKDCQQEIPKELKGNSTSPATNEVSTFISFGEDKLEFGNKDDAMLNATQDALSVSEKVEEGSKLHCGKNAPLTAELDGPELLLDAPGQEICKTGEEHHSIPESDCVASCENREEEKANLKDDGEDLSISELEVATDFSDKCEPDIHPSDIVLEQDVVNCLNESDKITDSPSANDCVGSVSASKEDNDVSSDLEGFQFVSNGLNQEVDELVKESLPLKNVNEDKTTPSCTTVNQAAVDVAEVSSSTPEDEDKTLASEKSEQETIQPYEDIGPVSCEDENAESSLEQNSHPTALCCENVTLSMCESLHSDKTSQESVECGKEEPQLGSCGTGSSERSGLCESPHSDKTSQESVECGKEGPQLGSCGTGSSERSGLFESPHPDKTSQELVEMGKEEPQLGSCGTGSSERSGLCESPHSDKTSQESVECGKEESLLGSSGTGSSERSVQKKHEEHQERKPPLPGNEEAPSPPTSNSDASCTLSDEERAFPDPDRPDFDVTRIPLPDECVAIRNRFRNLRGKNREESDNTDSQSKNEDGLQLSLIPRSEKRINVCKSRSFIEPGVSQNLTKTLLRRERGRTAESHAVSVAVQCTHMTEKKKTFGFQSKASQTHKIKIKLRPRPPLSCNNFSSSSQTLMEVVDEVSQILDDKLGSIPLPEYKRADKLKRRENAQKKQKIEGSTFSDACSSPLHNQNSDLSLDNSPTCHVVQSLELMNKTCMPENINDAPSKTPEGLSFSGASHSNKNELKNAENSTSQNNCQVAADNISHSLEVTEKGVSQQAFEGIDEGDLSITSNKSKPKQMNTPFEEKCNMPMESPFIHKSAECIEQPSNLEIALSFTEDQASESIERCSASFPETADASETTDSKLQEAAQAIPDPLMEDVLSSKSDLEVDVLRPGLDSGSQMASKMVNDEQKSPDLEMIPFLEDKICLESDLSPSPTYCVGSVLSPMSPDTPLNETELASLTESSKDVYDCGGDDAMEICQDGNLDSVQEVRKHEDTFTQEEDGGERGDIGSKSTSVVFPSNALQSEKEQELPYTAPSSPTDETFPQPMEEAPKELCNDVTSNALDATAMAVEASEREVDKPAVIDELTETRVEGKLDCEGIAEDQHEEGGLAMESGVEELDEKEVPCDALLPYTNQCPEETEDPLAPSSVHFIDDLNEYAQDTQSSPHPEHPDKEADEASTAQPPEVPAQGAEVEAAPTEGPGASSDTAEHCEEPRLETTGEEELIEALTLPAELVCPVSPLAETEAADVAEGAATTPSPLAVDKSELNRDPAPGDIDTDCPRGDSPDEGSRGRPPRQDSSEDDLPLPPLEADGLEGAALTGDSDSDREMPRLEPVGSGSPAATPVAATTDEAALLDAPSSSPPVIVISKPRSAPRKEMPCLELAGSFLPVVAAPADTDVPLPAMIAISKPMSAPRKEMPSSLKHSHHESESESSSGSESDSAGEDRRGRRGRCDSFSSCSDGEAHAAPAEAAKPTKPASEVNQKVVAVESLPGEPATPKAGGTPGALAHLEISDIRTVSMADMSVWSGSEVVPVPVDSVYNWPYVEEVFTEAGDAEGEDDGALTEQEWVADQEGEERGHHREQERPQLRCSLSWDRILPEGERLVLGPAKIEVRLADSPAKGVACWNVINRDRRRGSAESVASSCQEENNNLMPGAKSPLVMVKKLILKRPNDRSRSSRSSRSRSPSHTQSQSDSEQDLDSGLEGGSTPRGRRPLKTKGALKSYQQSETERALRRKRSWPRGSRFRGSRGSKSSRGKRWCSDVSSPRSVSTIRSPGTVDSDVSCGEVPRVIIKRKSSDPEGGHLCYESYLQSPGPAGCDQLQLTPVVVLCRSPSLDAMALKLHGRRRKRFKSEPMLDNGRSQAGREGAEDPGSDPAGSGANILKVVELLKRWRQEEEEKAAAEQNGDVATVDSQYSCWDRIDTSFPAVSDPVSDAASAVPESPRQAVDDEPLAEVVLERLSPCMVSGESPAQDDSCLHRCDACQATLRGAAARAAHIKQHPYHCQRCFLAFSSQTDFMQHLKVSHPNTQELHHCLLCLRTFPTGEQHAEHIKSWNHMHMERSQRRTIHTLYRMFTGADCPRLSPLTDDDVRALDWLPNDSGVIHFYHQATPLQLATEDWHVKHGESASKDSSS